MKVEIKVPAMGESISEATIGNIIKPTGSAVVIDDEILELETDKVNQVLYAPQAGTLSLTVKPEDVVKIGQVIGYVETDAKGEKPIPAEKPPETSVKAPEEKKITQAGVRMTKEAFISDVKIPAEKPLEKPKAPPKPQTLQVSSDGRETRRKMTRIRKVIAQRLVEAQHNAAMLTTFNEVDLSQVMALREKFKEPFLKKYGAKLGFMSFFVKAATSALEAFPEVNSYIDGDDVVHREYYDVGIAVGTDRGLVVPVLRDCNHLSFGQIEQTIEGFAKKARDGSITVDELQGGGFTITNGGVYGSLLSTPILNPPQSAILGMHKIEKRPVVVDDQIVIRPMMYLALSYDHRLIDGKEAVSFLVHIKNILEEPSRLALEV